MSTRDRQFHKGLDHKQKRMNRYNHSLSLRKEKRENILQEKRKKFNRHQQNNSFFSAYIIRGFFNENAITQYTSVKYFRMSISQSMNNMIMEQITNSQCIQKLIEFCTKNNDHQQLKHEALWSLSNIAAQNNYVKNIIKNNGHSHFQEALRTNQFYQIKEQALLIYIYIYIVIIDTYLFVT